MFPRYLYDMVFDVT